MLAVTALGIVRFAGQTAAISDKPSIAVLPFANLSRDPEQDYLSDGIAEDLITNLSSFSELVVSARNSSFAYRGKSMRARQIGRDLGVRYLLQGSVHRDREQLRIMVQLVDAPSERQVWAKQYDRPFAAVFALQDAITQEILASLVSNIRVADVNRMMPVPAADLSAYELVLRAREASFRTATESSNIEARALAELAVEADPSYASAHVELGRTYYRAFVLEWEGASALDLALESARRAMSLDQRSASAHELLGRIHLRRGQHETAIAMLETALALNVNRADSYASLADALTFAGRAEEAVPLLEKAMRLDPHYLPQLDMYLGRALYFLRRYPRAQMMLEACVTRAPGFRPCYMYLAPVYAELDRIEEARRVAAELLKLSPQFTVERSVRRHLPFVEGPMQQFAEGLLKAGVPER
jgi:TolB-like protein/Tfp pilus assembly protein PilF